MIKKLSKSIRDALPFAIVTPLLCTGEVVLEVLIPMVLADIIDNGISAGSMSYILRRGILMLTLAMLSLLFGALSGRTAALGSARFARNLRHDMFYTIQDYSFSNIDKFSTSSLVTRLTTDVNNVQISYQMLTRIAMRCPLILIAALVMAFRVNSEVAMIFVFALPLLAIGLTLVFRLAHPHFKKVFSEYDNLNNVVQENLQGIRVVKSFVREDYEISKFTKVSKKIYDGFTKAEGIAAFNGPILQFVVYACMLLISWFGAHLIVGGTMSTGDLMSFITYAMMMLMSLNMLAMVMVMITISGSSAERIVEVLEEKSTLSNCENPVYEIPDGSVDFNHVNFSYAGRMDKLCLKDVDIHIRSGQTVGILGGTGSSKSSFVQLIPRLYDVTEGSVYIGGRDVREYDLDALRENVAMVLQKNVLFSGTIRENLCWGNKEATDEQIREVCRLACADEFIERFPHKYDTYIEQGGTNVSGGQKQRLCIARALLKKPKILILDDSTSAVDTKTDAAIRSALREFLPETTKFIIAQRISSVQDADVIIVMDNGQIHGVGTHEELLASNDIYREVYESQNKEAKSNG
ncbi:MAG: ABC transporter ATP-binding protein [Lachnospiraceae bacterium]